MSDLKQLCIDLEHFETPVWAAKAILEKEDLGEYVLDPCCGSGILTQAAFDKDYHVHAIDIHIWGYKYQHDKGDFLQLLEFDLKPFSVFMNPPFSKATDFVLHSLKLGAEKIVCFQRFAWWESKKRREFWEKNPPARVYICGDRADCWRHDLPVNARGKRYDPKTGKELSNSPTAHAWFVWEQGHAGPTTLHHVYKEAA